MGYNYSCPNFNPTYNTTHEPPSKGCGARNPDDRDEACVHGSAGEIAGFSVYDSAKGSFEASFRV